MKVIHCGVTYECEVAVKCENDCYIKLYDASGAEIISFHGISDFAEFEISGGDFIAPCDCALPIVLTTYVIGGRTITTNDWILAADNSGYYYEIESNLISENAATCDIFILFAKDTDLTYTATQASGKVTINVEAAPLADIVIESIQITRV